MKFLPLLWSSLWRKKVRTIFTLASIFVAFLLFGLLMTIRTAFTFGVDIAGLDRLILIHKVALIMPLPVSYLGRLSTMEGVTLATHQSWFGGVYQDPVQLLRADGGGARAVHDDVPGVQDAGRTDGRLEGGPAGRGRRRGSGEALQLEGRGSHSHHRHDLAAETRARSGTSTSSACTTAKRASTRRSSSSATTTSTRTAPRARAWSAGTS